MSDAGGLLVAYVGPVALPNGGAAARRMLGIAKSLRLGGARVLFGSGQLAVAGEEGPDDFEGFPIYSLNERRSEHLPVWMKHLSYIFMGRRTRQWLASLDPAPDAVVLYSGYLPYFLNLSGWCRQRGIPLIFDAVEWYDPTTAPGGPLGLYRWNIEIAMRWCAVRAGNILAISSYLERYYRARGCRTLRVPPTLEVGALAPPAPPLVEGTLNLAYSGRPGKKDQLDRIMEAVLRVSERGLPVRLRLGGMSPEALLSYSSLQRRGGGAIPDCMEPFGDLSHERSMDLVRRADFSVLLRDPDRVSEAGFPTKVVESLALGTPVISNLTGDLGRYLQAGVNALVCTDASVEALVDALGVASKLSSASHQLMRQGARDTALRHFDSSVYACEVVRFVNSCSAKRLIP